jgi:hypothetical protein
MTTRNQAINILGDIFTIIFFIEASMKIAGMGFIFHRYSYMRDPWNALDLLIVTTG